MTAPRILVVVGTPLADSLNHALARAYVDAARDTGAEVRVTDLAAAPIPAFPRARDELRAPRTAGDAPLDPAAAASIDDVVWADHLVFFFPQWWGGAPAVLKAWIDRVFLSGSAFRYRETGRLWDKLLTGRTARIIMTMDSPGWWNALTYRDAAIRQLRSATLRYCGVAVRGVTRLSEVRHRRPADRDRWVDAMASFARTDGEALRAHPRARVAVAA
ncbi:NAD(P)H-dependent oxidoreductase [Microbacterium xanthum]|uniref:NAD(P)H-dependent oxidoreductase n=1 Tax=Microbacterium xanthum TaxID=3079794 RepID=UPI002AD415FF|nr:NAD(P)H-dependent oxidoreductase [Microbacterium sp. KSW-48]MDZ8170952.1 NAD(P)H-dependent oxidoreductase [Microbacterium sp. KSW-48]